MMNNWAHTYIYTEKHNISSLLLRLNLLISWISKDIVTKRGCGRVGVASGPEKFLVRSAQTLVCHLWREKFFGHFLIFPGWQVLKNLLIQIQVKDEEWGEFVDMNSDGTSISLPWIEPEKTYLKQKNCWSIGVVKK